MSLVSLLVRVIITIAAFYIGLEIGRIQSSLEVSPCAVPQRQITLREVYPDQTLAPLPKCTTPRVHDHCIVSPFADKTFLHVGPGSVATDIFYNLHHPSSPAKTSFIITQSEHNNFLNNASFEQQCTHLFLTRTGSRASQPNKCVAVARVAEGLPSIVQHSYRTGYTALLTNQYLNDYARGHTYKEEIELLPLLLNNLPALIEELRSKMGDPLLPDGSRKTAIVMVANEGVMDLTLNFMCSAEASGIDISTVVIFVGTKDYVSLVEDMGAQAIYSPSLGSMPANAAGSYLDNTFAKMMWFKTTSVFLALTAGYDVLFQDVDLVWMKDPVPYMKSMKGDILFMDDGARTPRYTPFFVNSGFYYMKYNPRTLFFMEKMMKCGPSEIGYSHSHQAVLIRHIAETVHLIGLQIVVLNNDEFPSGQAYHERKNFIKKIQNKEVMPYVFHMCWTDNRENKIVYFKDVGLWYLPDGKKECTDGKAMLKYEVKERRKIGKALPEKGDSSVVRDHCCMRKAYFKLKAIL